MVEVAETDSLALTAEIVIEFMGTEVELEAEFWRLNKKRMIDVHKSTDMCVSWSLDRTVSFRLLRDGRKTVNEATVFFLPEELRIFTRALMQHSILFPHRYSQRLSLERGMHCIKLPRTFRRFR